MGISGSQSLVERLTIGPQPGPQSQALACKLDLLIYGGAAGAGKSFDLLLEGVRGYDVRNYYTTIFRRETTRILESGGLWDEACDLYSMFKGATSNETKLTWDFPSGARVKFAHMEHEKDRKKYAGAQIAMLGFDQVEEFTEKQFWFMHSRLRSMSGVKPYVRCTCNPVPIDDKVGGWLRQFIDWWIDDETGLPNLARAGKVRWFARPNDVVEWAPTKKELVKRYGADCAPQSVTFIPGKLTDNPALMKADPTYLTRLRNLPKVDRERLLYGNWNARESAGMFFQRHWFPICATVTKFTDQVRYWDRAATPSEQAKGRGSWTAGVRMGKTPDGTHVITDVVRFQGSALEVERGIKNTADQDGPQVRVGIEQDPGQAGKAEANYHVKNLAGYSVQAYAVREAKGIRARPLSAQSEGGNVLLVAGAWNEAFLREAENFDGSDHCTSDQIDAASGAFNALTSVKRAGTWGRRR